MKDNKIFGGRIRLQIMLDCFHGLHHLHSHFFLHGDIKPQNILLDENMRAKITDFGSCEFMITDEKIVPYHEFGKNGFTAGYVDPNIFRENKQESNNIYAYIDAGYDIYSMTMVMCQLLSSWDKLFNEFPLPTKTNYLLCDTRDTAFRDLFKIDRFDINDKTTWKYIVDNDIWDNNIDDNIVKKILLIIDNSLCRIKKPLASEIFLNLQILIIQSSFKSRDTFW